VAEKVRSGLPCGVAGLPDACPQRPTKAKMPVRREFQRRMPFITASPEDGHWIETDVPIDSRLSANRCLLNGRIHQ